jgi:glycosyltransferase involved in cell wall biosynthesis
MALIYQSCHLVCQPSRGEGFGMCPLEARACGVPVVATATTGHSDHMSPQPAGCVVVATGDDSPINDGPGALAPSLSVEAVEAALEEAYKSWRELHRAALEAAPAVAEEWSWANQTKRWLKDMELWRNG